MHMDLASNQPVPVPNGTFTVTLTRSSGDPLIFEDVAGDAAGKVTVDAGIEAANVTGVTVIDSYGNGGAGAL